jgi:hypothetical protein
VANRPVFAAIGITGSSGFSRHGRAATFDGWNAGGAVTGAATVPSVSV